MRQVPLGSQGRFRSRPYPGSNNRRCRLHDTRPRQPSVGAGLCSALTPAKCGKRAEQSPRPYNQTPIHPQLAKPFRLPHVERRDTQVPPYGETAPPYGETASPFVGRDYPKGTGSTSRSCFAVCRWRYSALTLAKCGKRAEQSPAPTTDAPCFQMSIPNSLHPFSHVARMTSSTSSPRMAAMRSATRRT